MPELAETLCAGQPVDGLRQAMTAGVNAPLSSSAGRLFDAFAAGLGLVTGAQNYEGEAAMRLEALARQAPESAAHPYPLLDTSEGLDPVVMWEAWLGDRVTDGSPAAMAMRFHAGLAHAFAAKARGLIAGGAARAVALSGGCFQNALLLDLTVKALGDVPVLIHTRVPANDGGLALGQALVASAQVDRG